MSEPDWADLKAQELLPGHFRNARYWFAVAAALRAERERWEQLTTHLICVRDGHTLGCQCNCDIEIDFVLNASKPGKANS